MLGTPWAMEPGRLGQLAHRVATAADPLKVLALRSSATWRGYRLEDGRAHIEVRGVLMRRAPWYAALFGGVTETDTIAAQVLEADQARGVEAIVLHFDSPGGEVDGLEAAAEAIAGATKPTLAVVDGLAASGAYWLASQADEVSATSTSQVGSIGVYTVLTDSSKAAERRGIKVHVLRSGEQKGVGVPGAPIADASLDGLREVVDGLAALFVGRVASGRRLSPAAARELATGQTWLAAEAQKRGLVDRVEGLDAALVRSRSASRVAAELEAFRATRRPESISPEQQAANARRIAELRGQLAEARTVASARARARAEYSNPAMAFLEQAQARAADRGLSLHQSMRELHNLEPGLAAEYRRIFGVDVAYS